MHSVSAGTKAEVLKKQDEMEESFSEEESHNSGVDFSYVAEHVTCFYTHLDYWPFPIHINRHLPCHKVKKVSY